jgi:hypothetical protein
MKNNHTTQKMFQDSNPDAKTKNKAKISKVKNTQKSDNFLVRIKVWWIENRTWNKESTSIGKAQSPSIAEKNKTKALFIH